MTTLSEAVFFARNLLAAKALIKEVPKYQIKLSAFVTTIEKPVAESHETIRDCGAVACLGGWVAVAPYFRALGVVPGDDNNAPRIPSLNMGSDSEDVAEFLFGDSEMFSGRNGSTFDHSMSSGASDRKVALNRIKMRLNELLEEHWQLEEFIKGMRIEINRDLTNFAE